ncbi:MAG TPA: hypothetical protein VF974_04830 [Patescibacteria group bacterium]
MSTQLSSATLVGHGGLYSNDSVQLMTLGQKIESADGRIFRYALAGGVTLVSGNLLQSPAVVAGNQTLTPTAFAIGATSISVTMGATSVTANQYAMGYANINTTPGNGFAYLISGHAAITNAVAGTINLSDPVQVAGTAASIVDLVLNPYSGVLQAPVTTLTGTIVGGAVAPITNAQFGWVQTHGCYSALSSGTAIVGSLLGGVPSAAGSVTAFTGVLPVVGYTMKVGVDAKNVPVFLQID